MTTGGDSVSSRVDEGTVRGRTEEGDGFPAVEQTVVVGEGDDHDGTDDNLTVDDDGSVLDRVHT